ncbi:prolyl-tRNA synthetase associated domain-containing protein [Alkalibacter rhizosphaerae]|uniref:Prolyl-tRNA synthetase associated domain-containing protein n=1 Tax=Alkalibacter rhizosphaerae TaxID=2815577 RepID=A0A975AHC1_9FIRM|nr:prolyl-tRNA synthetase associated domain-containing protein [Alkalibacter rhizosphaerae]QSX07853.1 prolyl-tRNA synthetase associated domain-containing protein [Alkalibacter rhizosphaerae]
MTESRQKVFDVLERLGIQVEWEEHPPVFTIDEMDDLGISGRGCVVKNLFLRDAKGKRHFLVVLAKDKQADLKGLQERIGCSKLSFASEDRLKKHLDLTKGAVTPLGVINNEDRTVEVILDGDLVGQNRLGVHPNDNMATLWIAYEDLLKLIKDHGNPVTILDEL